MSVNSLSFRGLLPRLLANCLFFDLVSVSKMVFSCLTRRILSIIAALKFFKSSVKFFKIGLFSPAVFNSRFLSKTDLL